MEWFSWQNVSKTAFPPIGKTYTLFGKIGVLVAKCYFRVF